MIQIVLALALLQVQTPLQEMVQTEQAFPRMAAEKNTRDAFMAYIADDGLLFRPGGVNGTAFTDSPNRTYGPEVVTDYEAGLKSNWFFGEVAGLTNIAVFYDSYDRIQRSTSVFEGGVKQDVIFFSGTQFG